MILDGSASSLDDILETLDYFAEIVGLNINFFITSMMRMGSKIFFLNPI